MSETPHTPQEIARRLVAGHGESFASQAGIELVDEPGALWQLLVLAQLLSTRISSGVALATARELWKSGWTTPAAMRATTWNQRVAALGRGGYRRYDFSTSTRLGENLQLVASRWHDDLRELRDEASGDPKAIAKLLTTFDGIGPVGASIFLREVQAVWPSVRPFADQLVLTGAGVAGLPQDPAELAQLVDDDEFANLAAALVKVARKPSLARVER